jgi:serine/threonine protein kinase/Tol biopolymer transport system component
MKPERFQEIDKVFQAALDRGPADRAGFLAEACQGDAELRQQVELLLSEHEKGGRFIEAPAYVMAADLLADEESEVLADEEIAGYRILQSLGKGGMGHVYLALDVELGRRVALKLLRTKFSGDAEGLRRFKQEACAAALLSDPNVAHIYEIGETRGRPYIAMEYVEGETLRRRIARSRIKPEEALDIARQVASALSAAHAAGIVHRDIKPENVIVRPDGLAKVLDFGLAKLTETLTFGHSQTSLATVQTEPGVLMGTLSYISPEQARGQSVDAQTDIWSLGVVFYEMITGCVPFQGATRADKLAAIMDQEPEPISTVQPMVQAGLEQAMMTCLEKDPSRRWRTSHDLLLVLKCLAEAGPKTGVPALVVARRRGRERLALIAASALLAIAVLAFGAAYLRRATIVSRAMRFNVPAPEKTTLEGISLSPDGSSLAFTARESASGKAILWVRPLHSLDAQPLAGTNDASFPFWSPDGKFIGFFAQGKLKKVDLAGGPPAVICSATSGRGGTWNRDGVIIYTPNGGTCLYRVSVSDGQPSPLTTLDLSRGETTHRWPQFLPDGHSFLYFTGSTKPEARGVYVGSLDSMETKRLLSADSTAVYASPGYLLFLRESTLMAQSFDARELKLAGEPASIAERVGLGSDAASSFAFLTASGNGVLAYHGGIAGSSQLVWFDRAGTGIAVIGSSGRYSHPALSPDGRRIAFDRADQEPIRDIWLLEIGRGLPSRFTFEPAPHWFPVWSHDGGRVAFASKRGTHMDLYQKAASGVGGDESLLESPTDKLPTDWSLDGRFVLYEEYDRAKPASHIWLLPLQGNRKPFPFLQTEFNQQEARFSPDTRWIAYTSDESGSPQVYVQDFSPSGSKWQISASGGNQPMWRRDGRELFFVSADGKLMSVEVKTEPSFQASAPSPLFDIHSPNVAGRFRRDYAVSPNGQRFLVNSIVDQTAATPVTVVLNWTADLKR